MDKTKEIRWIFKNNNSNIEHWFESLGFETLELRVDQYLDLNNRYIGVKLRDGNIEIKHSIESQSKGSLTPRACGYFEEYIKWSFKVEENELLYANITKGACKEWVGISKRRKAAKLKYENEEIAIYPIEESLEFGCQLEYTEIELDENLWYSFALEWFGAKHIDIKPDFISEILGGTKLNSKESKSYMVFLSERKMTS